MSCSDTVIANSTGMGNVATGPLTVDPRQTIRWAYAFLLGREPENEAIIDQHLRYEGGATLDALRQRLIFSDEFLSSIRQAGLLSTTVSVGPLEGMLGEPPIGEAGFFTDRFGVRTRTRYLPPLYEAYSGKVGSPDGKLDMPVHEPEELNALLRSVAEAKKQFTALELGAGWGPWIVLGAFLARRRGLHAALMGVEGSSDHVDFMRTHMADNGFDPASHQIVHAVVGSRDVVAYFPKLPDPSGDWGAQANYDAERPDENEMEEVACLSLHTLLGRMPVVDFLHCDVQGAEAEVIEAAIESVNQRVRRTCIGTHSRGIEAKLLDLMTAQGWVLEHEKACRFNQDGTKLVLTADGVQVWRNPRAL